MYCGAKYCIHHVIPGGSASHFWKTLCYLCTLVNILTAQSFNIHVICNATNATVKQISRLHLSSRKWEIESKYLWESEFIIRNVKEFPVWFYSPILPWFWPWEWVICMCTCEKCFITSILQVIWQHIYQHYNAVTVKAQGTLYLSWAPAYIP